MSKVALPLQIVLLLLTLSLQTATGVTTEYGWRVSQWNPAVMIMLVELFKFVVSSVFHIKERKATNQPTLFADLSLDLLWDTRHYAIPSLLYMIGNNLAMSIYQYLPSHIVTMTVNLKIVAVMFIAHRFLGQQFSTMQWFSSVVILIGVTVIQYNPGQTEQNISNSGIVIVTLVYGVVQAIISATAGAYCEYLYKTIEKVKATPEWQRSIHVQNIKLYFYGVVFNIVGAGLLSFYTSYSQSKLDTNGIDAIDGGGGGGGETETTSYTFHWIQLIILCLNITGGLVIGLIMKYMDNVVRNIIGSMALVTVTIASTVVLHNEMTGNFLMGALIVISGAQMYIWGRRNDSSSVMEMNRKNNQKFQKSKPLNIICRMMSKIRLLYNRYKTQVSVITAFFLLGGMVRFFGHRSNCTIQLRPTGKFTIVRNNLKAPNGAHNFLNWTHMNFDSCAVVGSGSSLLNSGFGTDIDNHDAVFRINSAPTKGFHQDVGSFTTFRVSYGITCLHALMTDEVPSNGICTAESTGKEYVLGAFNLMKKDIAIHERLYKRAWGNLLYNHTKIKSAKDLHMFYHLSGKAASYYGLEVYKATSGYNAILASLDLCNSIDLYGFDLGHSMSLNHMPKKAHYYDIYDTTYATKKEGQPHNFLNEWKRINQMTNTTEWVKKN